MDDKQYGSVDRQQLVGKLDDIAGKVEGLTAETAPIEAPAIAEDLRSFKTELQQHEGWGGLGAQTTV